MTKKNVHMLNTKLGLSIFILALMVSHFAGCGTVKKTTNTVTKPFSSSQRINLTPFAEQMIAMVGELQFGLSVKQPVYILHLMDTPEVETYRKLFQQFKINISKILAYSARVVTLSRTGMPGPERANALVDYIHELRPREKGPTAVKFNLSGEEIDAILETVRQQENLLDALKAAQPLADEMARFMRRSIDELNDAQEQAENSIRQKINDQHSVMLDYIWVLKNRQEVVLERLQALHAYRSGDRTMLAKITRDDPELKVILPAGKKPSYQKLKSIEATLTERLGLLDAQFKHLSEQRDLYRKQVSEINTLADKGDHIMRKTKLAIIVWGRVHRQMAAGITDPAMIDVFGMMKKAVDTAL